VEIAHGFGQRVGQIGSEGAADAAGIDRHLRSAPRCRSSPRRLSPPARGSMTSPSVISSAPTCSTPWRWWVSLAQFIPWRSGRRSSTATYW
jgi:hypothetical protein